MIIISCPNCKKPILLDHKYKLEDGGPVHVDCEKPGSELKFVEPENRTLNDAIQEAGTRYDRTTKGS